MIPPNRSRKLAALGAGLLCFAAAARADYERDNYRDIRWLGRGNAGIAMASDGTALFYNPAGLARIGSVSMEFLNPVLAGNQNFVSSFSELSTLTSGNQSLNQKFAPFLGKPLGLQGNVFPHVAMPGLAFGVWDYLDTSLEYKNPVNPELDIDARNDYGLVFGGALNYKRIINVGASLRYQRRRALLQNLTAGSVLGGTTALLSDLQASGDAYAITVGMQIQQNWANSFAAFGLVLEDVGTTTFRNQTGGSRPDRQKQMLNAGVSYGAKAGPGAFTLSFDVRSLNNQELDVTKKIFTGAEMNLLMFDFRLGLFQGYWTAGFSWKIVPFLSLDLATYGEELGSAAGIRRNRYWMLGLRMGADLGQKTKKKQKYTLDQYK